LDSTRPPQVVVEQVALCRDPLATGDELRAALAPAAAPDGAWVVRARFERSGGQLTVHGDVVNAAGVAVASRALSGSGNACASLARGLGVWASLVLDAEVDRARTAPAASPPDDPLAGPPASRSTTLWPTSPPPDPRPPESDLFLSHSKDKRTVELGLDAFVMGGTGSGAVIGPSVYGIFEASHAFFLRPALLVGHSVGDLSPSGQAPATFLGSRFDACARLPGLYLDQRGLQLDLCGGAEVGFSQIDGGVVAAGPPGSSPSQTMPFFALGPSFGLRGELGSSLSAVVRGVTDISFLREDVYLASGGEVTPPLFAWRAEVGLSWSVR